MAILLATVSTGFYVYYKDSQYKIQILAENNAKLTMAIEQQKLAFEAAEKKYKNQLVALTTLTAANQKLSAEKEALSNKLMKHDLEELSRRKPGLVENRINNGTKDIFTSIMQLSTE